MDAGRGMTKTPVVGLAIRSVAASLWAGVMVILGLVVLFEGPGPLPFPPQLFALLGVAAVAGGQFVFMVLVADRLLRGAHRRAVVMIEVGTFALFVAGVGATMGLFAMGTWA
ncbi:MAG: hypothetical protein ACOYN0_17035 [Phycisphaerales bacterium]